MQQHGTSGMEYRKKLFKLDCDQSQAYLNTSLINSGRKQFTFTGRTMPQSPDKGREAEIKRL